MTEIIEARCLLSLKLEVEQGDRGAEMLLNRVGSNLAGQTSTAGRSFPNHLAGPLLVFYSILSPRRL